MAAARCLIGAKTNTSRANTGSVLAVQWSLPG